MLKTAAFISAFLITMSASAQETVAQKPAAPFRKYLVSINVSPDICFRTLKNNDGSDFAYAMFDARKDSEDPKFGYTAGLNLRRNFSHHVGIEAGIQYSNKGYTWNLDIDPLTTGYLIDPRYGFVYTYDRFVTKVKCRYNFIYLDIPVRAIFTFGKKKLCFIASIGAVTNILLTAESKTYSEYSNGETSQQKRVIKSDYNSLNFSPMFSVGVGYKLSDRFNLAVEPTFRYGVLKINDFPVTDYLWNAGLNFSCYYALR